jgi:16S rRNA pseudouridine516 synthase
VTVDETVCRAPEQKVAPEEPVTVDGQRLGETGPVYLMLHKPAGVVSATEDSREQTVLSLLPEPYQRLGLFPVGRLDKDTEGLLLLTDDGALAHRLLAPRNHVDKVYYLEVDGVLDQEDVQAAERGVTLADGYTCMPAKLEPLPGGRAGRITIHEGKYHQVKRMMAALGKPVTYLKRVRFGPLDLDPELGKSCWRPLTEGEKTLLFRH